jgi:hypothetical protein
MAQPNYFRRNSANLEFGNYDSDTEILEITGAFPTGDWCIKDVVRFDDGGNTNAIMPFFLGGIRQFTVKAFSIWLEVEGTPLQSTNVDEILDFFMNP